MSVGLRGLVTAIVIAAVVAGGGVNGAPTRGYWLQGQPRDPSEEALRSAVDAIGPRTRELTAVSSAHPGTLASGLAQLEAGLRLLDERRSAEAIPFLQHPDIRQTHLADYALFAQGEAYANTRDYPRAAAAHLSVLEQYPSSPLRCGALLDAADAEAAYGRSEKGLALLGQAEHDCPDSLPSILAAQGAMHQAQMELKEAAEAYLRLDREFPASPEAAAAAGPLRALKAHVPSLTPAERRARDLDKAKRLMAAGKNKEALVLLRPLLAASAGGEESDEVRLRLGRAYAATGRDGDALAALNGISAEARIGGEASFERAKIQSRRQRDPSPFQAVADRYPNTPWAEDALLSLAYFHLKDMKEDQAIPYLQSLLQTFPKGRYADRSTWWIGWWNYRNGRYADTAELFERAVRTHPATYYTPGFLYWAGRARMGLGQKEQARELYADAVRRFKHSYHGQKAAEALNLVAGGASSTRPAPAAEVDAGNEIPDPLFSRARELLLVSRLEEAADELKRAPTGPAVRATLAWIDWRLGNYRSAIVNMQRAYPAWVGEAGDDLPPSVWQILYPLNYSDVIVARARQEGLDPALVAALIWQESAFDPTAVSTAGARGLMQILPPTGRTVSRKLGRAAGKKAAVRKKAPAPNLNDPATALALGTHYLRLMLDRFGGRVEMALAAYNAGPTRVNSWVAARPNMSAEEFVESIPFVETRAYVMNVLQHQEQYRRLYALASAARGEEQTEAQ
ncbi:MAG TPA: transglycosylase SLT domain-containing protein [Vicinamibacteria bacterium]